MLDRQFSESLAEQFPLDIARIVVLGVDDDHVRMSAAGEQRVVVFLDEVDDGGEGDEEVVLGSEAVEQGSVGADHARPVGFGERPVVELEVGVVLGVQDAAVVGEAIGNGCVCV